MADIMAHTRCLTCGTRIEIGLMENAIRICPECKRAIQHMKEMKKPAQVEWNKGRAYCTACGNRIPKKIGARFCPKCGAPIEWPRPADEIA